MKTKTALAISTMCAMLLSIGCFHTSNNPTAPLKVPSTVEAISTVDKTIETVASVQDGINEASGDVGKSAVKIDKHADDIHDAVQDSPAPVKDDVDRSVAGIKVETKSIKENVVAIDALTDKLNEANSSLKKAKIDLESSNESLTKVSEELDGIRTENAKLKEQLSDSQTLIKGSYANALRWLVLGGVLLLGLSATMIFNGNAKAIGITAFAVVVIVSSLSISFMMKQYAYAGFAGAIAVIGIIVYKYIYDRNREKALAEIVRTTEAAKQLMTEEQKVKVFGDGAIPGVAEQIQSASTADIVSTLRKKKVVSSKSTTNKE